MMPFFLLKNVTERCLPHLQGPTCPVHPSLHPCPAIPTSGNPRSSFSATSRTPLTALSLFSPVTPHISENQALLLAASHLQQKTPVDPLHQLPVGSGGQGEGAEMQGCIPGQGCCCLFPVGASSEHVVCTKFHLVVTLRTGFSSSKHPPPPLPYIAFSCPLPSQGA